MDHPDQHQTSGYQEPPPSLPPRPLVAPHCYAHRVAATWDAFEDVAWVHDPTKLAELAHDLERTRKPSIGWRAGWWVAAALASAWLLTLGAVGVAAFFVLPVVSLLALVIGGGPLAALIGLYQRKLLEREATHVERASCNTGPTCRDYER